MAPSKECDLILKGGITSGVVYPKAIEKIGKTFRLRSIGGTSAGAIAAVFAAAAEYQRQQRNTDAGFNFLAELGGELGGNLASLFQPTPKLAPLFGMLEVIIASQDKKPGLLLRTLQRHHKIEIGAFVAAFAILLAVGASLLAVILLPVLIFTVIIGIRFFMLVRKELPRRGFGLCPGLTQEGCDRPALTDWMAERLEKTAGRDGNGGLRKPLTVGDLKAHQIDVAAMTTDLSSGRPFQLPIKTGIFFFSQAEFRDLFPAWVVAALCDGQAPRKRQEADDDDVPDDLYRLPTGDDFPVLLIARMSLSFPVLISATPLYRFDYVDQQRIVDEDGEEREIAPMRRVLFSDGGISSNFPVHLFDAPLPQRPTFGISLGVKNRPEDPAIYLSTRNTANTNMPIGTLNTLVAFFASIIRTAMNWQDTLQALLPGYADRTVEVRLDPKTEGGLNLSMPRETIKRLIDYGERAADHLLSEFSFDLHRYVRALAIQPKLEESLASVHAAYVASYDVYANDTGRDGKSCPDLLRDGPNGNTSYGGSREWREREIIPFFEKLSALGEEAGERIRRREAGGTEDNFPAADAKFRFVADADRVPRDAD